MKKIPWRGLLFLICLGIALAANQPGLLFIGLGLSLWPAENHSPTARKTRFAGAWFLFWVGLTISMDTGPEPVILGLAPFAVMVLQAIFARSARIQGEINTQRREEQAQAQSRIEKNKAEAVACCPRCGSTSLSANNQGFGVGKAVVGASLFGALGLTAGNIHAKRVWVTCLNCGHRWKLS